MNESMPCPHCGGHGVHIWGGSGTCPGAAQQNLQSPFYPYGQDGPGYAPVDVEKQAILARLDYLEEENRRLWEAVKHVLG